MSSALILGVSGLALTPWETDFLRDLAPWGAILFARNVDDPAQLRRLTGEIRDALGWQAPILIDQEGGRVQRMRAPHWAEFLPALDQMARARDPIRAQWLRNRLIAHDLASVGIDVNCAPLADLVEDQTHPILRNRLYGSDIETVVAAARACADGLLAGGVLPVLKHLPGYGRAHVDSHLSLPRVDVRLRDLMARDFAPFRALNDLAMGMTAHIVLDAVDPTAPATISPIAMNLIRRDIGFDGLIMTDDIGMQALSGTLAERATGALDAGCDLVLQCSGVQADLISVATASRPMTVDAIRRAEGALAQRRAPDAMDISALQAELDELLEVGAG
jgi:beta-N-acetylhexosaminidase